MTDGEASALRDLALKVDSLVVKVDSMATEFERFKGRFEGGWWVLAVLGSVAAVIIGWFAAAHTRLF